MLNTIQITALGVLAVAGMALLVLSLKPRRLHDTPVDKPTKVIELPLHENPNPYPAIPEVAPEAQSISPVAHDKPNVVTVTPPVKLTKAEALQAANRNRSMEAKVRAADAAWDLDSGMDVAIVAAKYKYANARSLRRALQKYSKPQDVKDA